MEGNTKNREGLPCKDRTYPYKEFLSSVFFVFSASIYPLAASIQTLNSTYVI